MMEENVPPRFIVDHMLGSLARWLRMMGYDTVYDKSLDDAAIAKTAQAEGRTILTRDKALSESPGGFLLDAVDLDNQLKAIAQKFGLRFHDDLIRCSTCNGELVELPKEEAKGKVPDGAHAANEKFWRCSRCGKIYWKGSHWLGINERLRKLGLA